MEYTVVIKERLEDLIREVNELIKQGWKPQGSICASSNGYNGTYHYFQALIKN